MNDRLRTLTLAEAAAFLKMHPQSVRRLARQGVVPAAKPGRRWCFLEDDLARYLRALYAHPRQVPQGAITEDLLWHCTNAATRGGFDSRPPTAGRYAALLGLNENATHKSSAIDSKPKRGASKCSASSRGESGKTQSNDG